MQSNDVGLNDLLSSTADPRAAATDGEVSPHPVSIDIGHQNTAQNSEKVPGNARQEDRSDVARNIVLFEGSAGEVHQAVAELQLKFLSATLEPTAETARHRQLFLGETDGLPATAPADAITVAVRFETAPPRTPTAIPDALLAVKAITDRWRKTLTTGHVYFETRLVASAVAMVYCAGPRTGDVSRGLIGSLGGNRQAYFRLKRHFYDDDLRIFDKGIPGRDTL